MKIGLSCLLLFVLAGCSSARAPAAGDDEGSALTDAPEALEVGASSCRAKPGETLVHVTLKVDAYVGLQHGHNGDHELVDATITATTSAADPGLIDTTNVEVAMNVRSSTDPNGLPHEIPMAAGDSFEVEGEYIPAATSNAHNAGGPAAVVHFTHSPCGFATIGGQQYH